jgi:hypothetical protein
VSYKTALKAYDLLRRVLVEDLAQTNNLLKENSKRMNPILEVDEKVREAEVPVTRL